MCHKYKKKRAIMKKMRRECCEDIQKTAKYFFSVKMQIAKMDF